MYRSRARYVELHHKGQWVHSRRARLPVEVCEWLPGPALPLRGLLPAVAPDGQDALPAEAVMRASLRRGGRLHGHQRPRRLPLVHPPLELELRLDEPGGGLAEVRAAERDVLH